ncbi:MAG: hypothetical protein HY820_13790 [Acidobacteria bacterium]|nr:hypothetical protein [Acidobacteriota bacterium]
MFTRRSMVAGLVALPLLGDERADITRWLGNLANLLSGENASEFLRTFSRELRDKLDSRIWTLVRTAEVSSSVDILELKAEGATRELTVDWFLDLKPHATSNPSVQRRQQIRMRIEKAKKGWSIVALEPHDFFRPI